MFLLLLIKNDCLINNDKIEGLVNPLNFLSNKFAPKYKNKFINIIPFVISPGNNHWICVSNLMCENDSIDIYDSLELVNKTSVSKIENILKNMVDSANLRFNFKKVQKQKNDIDCGFFSLAFATALFKRENPEFLEFDDEMFRLHFNNCTLKKKIRVFPLISQKRKLELVS
jgi:Ulp1 family protease